MTSRYLLRRITDSIWYPNVRTHTYKTLCTHCYKTHRAYLLTYYDIFPMKSISSLTCSINGCTNPAKQWVFLNEENKIVRIGKHRH